MNYEDFSESLCKEIEQRSRFSFFALSKIIDDICESPIEKALAIALITREPPIYFSYSLESHFSPATVSFAPRVEHMAYLRMTESAHLKDLEFVTLFPQQKIGRYRVDFVLLARFEQYGIEKIIIECDGHDFHDRTKEQAQRDKARDRFLTSAGYKVMRFTGSEINRNPVSCADEIVAHLERLAHGEGL